MSIKAELDFTPFAPSFKHSSVFIKIRETKGYVSWVDDLIEGLFLGYDENKQLVGIEIDFFPLRCQEIVKKLNVTNSDLQKLSFDISDKNLIEASLVEVLTYAYDEYVLNSKMLEEDPVVQESILVSKDVHRNQVFSKNLVSDS
ncbi:hypothetical protein H8E77_15770 [bacterium]|nr:hypothetical protein [bacterium]